MHPSKAPGLWIDSDSVDFNEIVEPLHSILSPIAIFEKDGKLFAGKNGTAIIGNNGINHENSYPLLAYVPALPPENLGALEFKKKHNLRYAYVIGAMANGITSTQMVSEAAKAGVLGFFGAGGLTIERISDAIDELKKNVGDSTFGFNLIHSPGDLQNEQAVVDLYLSKGINLVSAAAYMRLTEPLVQYRVTGLHRSNSGNIICPNKVVAKASRVEVARQFFSPAPIKAVNNLLKKGLITKEEAELSQMIPMAEDLSAEADSGGHTDNRPALALLPTMLALRDEMMSKHNYTNQLNVGLGGGISTPESAAAAFSMGAAYILTGSVNQSCVEAGTSDTVKQLLAKTDQADVIMAPAADMFEMGVKVQVLKRGTMFALKAAKLYDFYRAYDSLEQMPASIIEELEKKFFKITIEQEWHNTETFFRQRDPKQLVRAEKDPKHKMALLFRSYLGRGSLWAIQGEPDRTIDYQIWCGPAMGAFNEWVKGSFLELPENRKVKTIAMNLLTGACVVIRSNWLMQQNISLPAAAGNFPPREMEEINALITPR